MDEQGENEIYYLTLDNVMKLVENDLPSQRKYKFFQGMGSFKIDLLHPYMEKTFKNLKADDPTYMAIRMREGIFGGKYVVMNPLPRHHGFEIKVEKDFDLNATIKKYLPTEIKE